MNLKMRKLLEINEGILRFMGRTAVRSASAMATPRLTHTAPTEKTGSPRSR
jgi:hypothetical protein